VQRTLSPEPSGGETVFAGPPTHAATEARTAVIAHHVPASVSLCCAHPPVAVVLRGETSGRPPLATDLRGGTSPQARIIRAPRVCLAREQAVSVP
jgi:hypothetical protein